MIKVIESEGYKNSYIIVDTETGEILDDAQGYGYKTVKKAYAAYFLEKPYTRTKEAI